jgi:hypothetical protein
MPGDYLDLSSDPQSGNNQPAANTNLNAAPTPFPFGNQPAAEPRDDHQSADSRKFVGVHFICCDIYSRIYINRTKTAYAGNCPRCMKKIELKIGPGGTSNRFFTAG